VGAFGYSTATGRAYIFYGGSIITENASGADIIITGEATNSFFGTSLAAGDFNADSKTDLAVGSGYSSFTGRAYLFYGGSIITEAATGADAIITGEASNDEFSYVLTAGDFNADGKTDLAVSASGYSFPSAGRVYIFYNGAIITEVATAADVIITGEPSSNLSYSLASGDFNSDGKTDLAVGAYGYASSRGKAYIFYSQNGQVNTNQSIVGETTSNDFGAALTTGDFNADGRIDLAVGAIGYSTETGRVYLFYGDGQIPATATTADAIITGEASGSYFGTSLTSGDWNADGRIDLAVGAHIYSSSTGRAYLFYGGSIITENASGADIIITGETTSNRFGGALAAGDWNADGKTDLAIGAVNYSTQTGRVYLFYSGSIITENASGSDVKITGEATNNYFGTSLASGDFNADGRTDLTVGSYGYSSNAGRAYLFYNGSIITENASGADVKITGEGSIDDFGSFLVTGDFNADGRSDLAIAADDANGGGTGRVYLFYNDGSIPTTAATADVIITGEASSWFGASLASGDWNADGRTDLAVGAQSYDLPVSNVGKAYFFYNDGSIPTTAATADVAIIGETTSNFFGAAMAAGDMNSDGRTDLIVSAAGFSTRTGKVYFYETRENFAWEIQEQFSPTGGTGRTGVNGTGQEIQITGEGGSSFGRAMTTGDFNADGKTDLAVGASSYSSSTGRVYVFYADGSLTVGASSADIIITGETTSNYFGISLAAGDYNADGKADLAVGAYQYSSETGRVYLFYNGSIITENASGADIIITGATTLTYFGYSLASGDFNADGKADLAVGAYKYSSETGRVYLFYNGSIITENASGADIILTGEAGSFFGASLTAGDFNVDGKTDLAVGAIGYSTLTGRTYIFYNGSIITENASGADIILTGEAGSFFGTSLASGDYNADGKTDLAVGAIGYSGFTGRTYIFYNGSIITEAATGADIIIIGEASSNQFSSSLTSGDWNADGRTDLAVGASGYSTSSTGRAYIFYNDGSIPTTAATADVILTGETTSNYFGSSLATGDWNADGKTDLAVGAYGYASNTGKVYIYTFNDPIITGEATSNYFGYSLASGDLNADGKTDLIISAYDYDDVWNAHGRVYIFYSGSIITENASGADVIISNAAVDDYEFFGSSLATGDYNADGKTDLAVGALGYSTNAGRAYLFYNDGSLPTTAATADIIITGEASSFFGSSLASGDWNADGKTDLAVGAYNYSSATGRTYLFYSGSIITEAATGADIIITGETSSYFGISLASGDFNTDGKTDLAVSAYNYSSATGRVYIFYSGSIITEAATGADIIITGETSSFFGQSLVTGDYNADGKTDLAIGGHTYSTNTGRVYLFHNDGSYPSTAATADVIITGETTNNSFGVRLVSGDFNADGKTDLVVGANGYSTNTGRVYTFYNGSIVTENASGADVKITGEATSHYFGATLVSGDFNADGKTDLAVGTYRYSSFTGRVYLYISEVAAPDALQDVSATTRGTIKTRGTLKVR
jgi:formylmethanofuran dehydrogenase subunit C